MPVGSAGGFSDGESLDLSLALDPQGMPWVAFRDRSDQSDKATVMRFTGAEWLAVGGPRFTVSSASSTSLALGASGTPYLAYVDEAQGFKATVVRFDGTSWQPAGPPGFSAGGADQTNLALDLNGRAFVAYRDGAADNKATVMRAQQTPSIACPASTVEATGPGGASVAIDASVDGDAADPLTTTWYIDDMDTAAATHDLPAGATQDSLTQSLAIGTHTVKISVQDGSGDPVGCSTSVTVRDTTPPTITAPADVTVQQVGSGGTAVNLGMATASDIVDANPVIANNAPALFPVGTTLVVWTATDYSGNQATATQRVTVTPATPPSIVATPSVIWPPDKKMVPVKLVVTSSGVPASTVRIVGVTCNEAISAADTQITGALTLNVRADRNGNGSGRIYTIKVAYGSASTTTVQVRVPHDEGR